VAAAPDYFVTDPRTAPIGQAWLQVNDPGHVAGASPVFLVQGDKDIVVLPARTAALLDRLCGVGQVVETLEVPGADHGTVTDQAKDQIGTWIAARFAGAPAVDDC
jgi:pimeloyl-ACP methyl ester carboxylesterase